MKISCLFASFLYFPSILNQIIKSKTMNKDVIVIWEEINSRLINFVNKQVKQLDLAEDIVHDVFLKISS